ncbi:MAG: diaminopimelate epimerase [Cyclobacteriaceae bacterium]|jgi:diaminopimelate epimerase|nr:diaminopimelate epimerase [Cyclobacteriaceae bacterium]
MKLHFFKYQATGNDFILIDNRSGELRLSVEEIRLLCDRKFGIGADGLMLIEPHPSLSFSLNYYNSDGSQSLCGNGSRAAVCFASRLGIVSDNASFIAYDGAHDAQLLTNGLVRLNMNDVHEVIYFNQDVFIDTGSPHYIRFVDDVKNYPVAEEGRSIRYNAAFAERNGTNVNFVELLPGNTIYVRTYERGVENETLSCGTGVTAAALAASQHGYTSPVTVKTPGGDLSVEFEKNRTDRSFTGIYLIGPAKMVFQGDLEL